MKLPFPGRLLAIAVISSLSLALPLSAAHAEDKPKAVSYTHLTLPTILLV